MCWRGDCFWSGDAVIDKCCCLLLAWVLYDGREDEFFSWLKLCAERIDGKGECDWFFFDEGDGENDAECKDENDGEDEEDWLE